MANNQEFSPLNHSLTKSNDGTPTKTTTSETPADYKTTATTITTHADTENIYGSDHSCALKLSTSCLYCEFGPHFYLCAKSVQTNGTFVFGDVVHFPKFDEVIDDIPNETLWIFVGCEVHAQVVVLFFAEGRYYDGKTDKKLHLVMTSVQGFGETFYIYTNKFRVHFNDPEYFLSDEFMTHVNNGSKDFNEGQFDTELSQLHQSKFLIIGAFQLKQSKTKKTNNQNNNTLAPTSSMSDTVAARRAATEYKRKLREEEQTTKATDEENKQKRSKSPAAVGKSPAVVGKSPAVVSASKEVKNTTKRPYRKREQKQPAGPFILFSNEMRKSIIDANPKLTFTQIGVKLGEAWKALSAEQKVSQLLL